MTSSALAAPGRTITVGFVAPPRLAPAASLALAQHGTARLISISLEDVLAGAADLPESCDAFVVLWELADLVAPSGAASGGSAIVDAIAKAATFLGTSGAPLFFGLLPTPDDVPLHDAQNPDGTLALVHRTNLALLKLASGRPQIHAFTWSVTKRDQVLARLLSPLVRPSAKLLAIDADGVLWDGIVGEAGVAGITFRHELAAYLDELRSAGVLVALVSKNEEADVAAAFTTHAPRALERFAACKIDWQPKHEHVRALAAEFNIGLDAIVFVDDQPFEREQMRFHLPEVQTLDILAVDEASIVSLLRASGLFDRLRVTADDKLRAADYATRESRAELARQASDPAAFLHALDLRVTIAPAGEDDVPRVVDLIGKTNQFNLTTRRHTEATVRRFMSDPRAFVLVAAVSDRFGDQGKVGIIIATPADAEGEAIAVDTFLMSCRVIGRGIEDAMWASLLKRVVARGFGRVDALYAKTARNDQVAELYDRYGFERIRTDEAGMHYRLKLPSIFSAPAWVHVDEH